MGVEYDAFIDINGEYSLKLQDMYLEDLAQEEDNRIQEEEIYD